MIQPLTSFRFIAALAVFFSHLTILKGSFLYDRFLSEGYAGVSFFFVLSGFILTYTYGNKLETSGERGKFYLARFARIYPVHALTLILSIPLVMPLFMEYGVIQWCIGILNGLLFQSYVPVRGVYFSFNSPSWSLSNEFFFYALLPLLLVIINKMQAKTFIGALALGYMVLVIMGLVLKDFPLNHWFFYISPFTRIFDFFVGIALALVYKKQRKLSATWEAMSILLLVVAIALFPYIPQTLRYGAYYLPFMAFMIYVFAHSNGVIAKLLSLKPLVYLGEISFTFYMTHLLVIRYGEQFIKQPGVLIIESLAITLVLSAVIYRFYELPLRKRIRSARWDEFIHYKWHSLMRRLHKKNGSWQNATFRYHHNKMKEYKR